MMYTVQIIKEDGSKGNMFTLDLEGMTMFLKALTPFKVKIEIQRVL